MSRGRRAPALLVVLLTVLLVPLAAAPVAAQTSAPPIPPPLVVHITDAGFVPSAISLAAGQTLDVRNDTATDQTFTATDGWIDSGPIPAGGRFVLATATGVAHAHSIASTTTPTFTAELSVGQQQLAGSPNALASTAIPSQVPGPGVIDVHPR